MSNLISHAIEQALAEYLENLAGEKPHNLYELVICQAEAALFKYVMHYTGYNQKQAANLLKVSRNTLRARLAKYNL